MKSVTYSKIKYILSGVVVVGLFCLSTFTFANTDAISYLQSNNQSAWSTIALIASGESVDVSYLRNYSGSSALDYTAPILALTAAGKDPRSYPNENFVEILTSYHTNNQIGDESLLNDDIFSVLALISAGVSPSDQNILDAKNFIINNQNSDGGWGFSVNGSSDTNTTAAAIMALRALNLSADNSVLVDAKSYLQSAQNDDGGFPYDPQSAWGTDSDASSDAWVISAIYALGEKPHDWTQNNATPVSHLLSLQTDEGYFKYQSGSDEDGFSVTTTAYALIALSGNSLPIATINAPIDEVEVSESHNVITYRIEGSDSTICDGSTKTETVLSLIEDTAINCGYTYTINDTAYGPYLSQIGSDVAAGTDGWLYYVDNEAGTVGADDYALEGSEDVVWYYGSFDWLFSRITLSDDVIDSGSTAKVQFEAKVNGEWEGVSDAVVHVGDKVYTTDEDGFVLLSLDDGIYFIYAEQEGYIRTAKEKLIVGDLSLSGNSVDLAVQIESDDVIETIAFSVDVSEIDFGTLAPGDIGSATVTVANQGDVPIVLESDIEGDDIFQEYLLLEGSKWENFSNTMTTEESSTLNVKLPVPNSYTETGIKSGILIFWATDNS